MCSRYSLTSPVEAVRAYFRTQRGHDFPPRYNIAPTQPVSIVRTGADTNRELVLVRWGLIPGWVKNPGESDGQCNIAGGARAWDYTAYNPWGWDATQQANNDPLWGIADPAAGLWFPQQALQLAQNAS